MSNKWKEELDNLELPDELHDRAKAGVKRAKEEKKRTKGWRKPVAAAVLFLGLTSVTLGFSFPSTAGQIPIVGNIFEEMSDSLSVFETYKPFSTELNKVEQMNGIQVTLNDAIFDGKTVTLTYSIITEKDLGEDLMVKDSLAIRGVSGLTGFSQIQKVDENEYVGLVTMTSQDEDEFSMAKVKWGIDQFVYGDSSETIEGDWSFSFKLESTDYQTKQVMETVEQDGVQVTLEKMTANPMSFSLTYTQSITEEVDRHWNDVNVDLMVKDDLGNVYEGVGNGGSGDEYSITWRETFQVIHPDASELIVTPHVSLQNSERSGGSVNADTGEEISSYSESGSEDPLPDRSFDLEDIVIDLTRKP
ncbi:DUF4179 domain-containing protein [Halobacillus litoralis]|uniref:DUF4179 domain-containing protein n=1 Tax=Halobacillus litoralis TaxID=45668 RepID=UPI001CD327B0|nr:DUF4179 domain-containing protein [Halobacillus litoralis]MCA0970549.1 DUF4179 domain-containing protein [Halobacillus litoralis]